MHCGRSWHKRMALELRCLAEVVSGSDLPLLRVMSGQTRKTDAEIAKYVLSDDRHEEWSRDEVPQKVPTVLALVFDTNLHAWLRAKDSKPDALTPAMQRRRSTSALGSDDLSNNAYLGFEDCVDAVLAYVHTFMLMNDRNRIAVVFADSKSSDIVYPYAMEAFVEESSNSTSLERILDVKEAICSAVRSVLDSHSAEGDSNPTALQYNTHISGALSLGLSEAIGTFNRRILTITHAENISSQYIAIMNTIFGAKKINAVMDTVVVSEADCVPFQQAADITGGIYLRLPAVSDGFLEHLMTVFNVEASNRRDINLPSDNLVDFRATCFQCRRTTNTGVVCSICLSVFCQECRKKGMRSCPTCGESFAKRRERTPTPTTANGSTSSAKRKLISLPTKKS